LEDYHIFDTNILLEKPELLLNYKNILIPVTVLEELDKHKNFGSEEIRYKAREAHRYLEKANINYICDSSSYSLPEGWENKNDNNILKYALEYRATMITLDKNMVEKCKALKIPYVKIENSEKEIYQGCVELNGDENLVNQIHIDIENGINTYGLLENQYLLIHNKDKRVPFEFKYVEGKLIPLRLPPTKIIKAITPRQRCALDLLNNINIPIKIILGCFGSGKTYTSLKMALYHVFEKGNYSNIVCIKNPIGVGERIGYLKGDKSEKIDPFMSSLKQYLIDENIQLSNINEHATFDIPYFIKGMSWNSTYAIVDESEDIDYRTLLMLGSRISKNSCIVFSGDYKQAETKYKKDNAILKLINKLKGNPLVGIIVLDEDVRSEASKVFANLFE